MLWHFLEAADLLQGGVRPSRLPETDDSELAHLVFVGGGHATGFRALELGSRMACRTAHKELGRRIGVEQLLVSLSQRGYTLLWPLRKLLLYSWLFFKGAAAVSQFLCSLIGVRVHDQVSERVAVEPSSLFFSSRALRTFNPLLPRLEAGVDRRPLGLASELLALAFSVT